MAHAGKDPAYLAAASRAVHAGIKSADADAVWLMQVTNVHNNLLC